MTDSGTHITVGLTSEECVTDCNSDVPLGILSIADVNSTLAAVRNELRACLPALPEQFQFITESGWPILENQEPNIKLCYVLSKKLHIRIKATYGQPRIGVKTVQGATLGFVFIEHTASLQSLRVAISEQLGDSVDVFHDAGPRYQFVDLNKWPISPSQEIYFRVLDVVRNACVHILTLGGLPALLGSEESTDKVDSAYSSSEQLDLVPVSVAASNYRQVTRQLTFRKVKDVERVMATDHVMRKQVLISYVRAEAANHALRLKTQLTNHGFSVYLDVHEIQSGEDWQDALNSAVTMCQAFVPLVTSRYGETMWTNREVKLADVLSKPIIPVSFLNVWPPRCLAIQFATTQFVYWKPHCDIKLDTECENLDISHWCEDDVTTVARQIAKRIKPDDLEPQYYSAASGLRKSATLRSCPAKLPDGFQILSQNREGRPLVVVSVHPKQKDFAMEVQGFLQAAGYEVWCSIQDLLDSTYADSPVFSQDSHGPGRHFERSMSESSALLGWSQCSQTSEDLEGNLKFQEKADEAGVIIVVLSKAYAQSKRCRQQVFYCEQRKKILPVKYEDFCMPGWMSMLIGTGILQNANSNNFEEMLKLRIKQSIHGELEDDKEKERLKVAAAAAALRREMPAGIYVYISGGTKFYHKDTESICKALGEALAGMECVHIVTGGFYGVGATVGQSYATERDRLNRPCNLWHILPTKDEQDRSHQGPQNKNKSFQELSYGKTLFSGDSVRERESIVSQVFPICVLIEGGPGAAHEAEEFVWNDGIVIPVECTGGAASGKFNVPDKIFELPVGVAVKDWYSLRNVSAGPKHIAEAITNILDTLIKRMTQCKAICGFFRTQSCPSPSQVESGVMDDSEFDLEFSTVQNTRDNVVEYTSQDVKVAATPGGSSSPAPLVNGTPLVVKSSACKCESDSNPSVSRQVTLHLHGSDSDTSLGFDAADSLHAENRKESTGENKTDSVKQDRNWFTKLKNDTASKQQARSESPKKKKNNLPPLPKLSSGEQRNTTPVKLSNSKTLPARYQRKNSSTKRTRQNVKLSADGCSSQQMNMIQASKKPRGIAELKE